MQRKHRIKSNTIKVLSKIGFEKRFKAISKKNPKNPNKQTNKQTNNASIILNEEILKSFPLSSGMRHRYLLLPLLFNIALDIFATAIR